MVAPDVRAVPAHFSKARVQRSIAATALALSTIVSFFARFRFRQRSNEYRSTRSTPFLVKIISWSATSSGVAAVAPDSHVHVFRVLAHHHQVDVFGPFPGRAEMLGEELHRTQVDVEVQPEPDARESRARGVPRVHADRRSPRPGSRPCPGTPRARTREGASWDFRMSCPNG